MKYPNSAKDSRGSSALRRRHRRHERRSRPRGRSDRRGRGRARARQRARPFCEHHARCQTRQGEASPTSSSLPATLQLAEATEALIKAGADCVKVGIGPGSICTTRVVAGIGVPQITAILECAEARGQVRHSHHCRRRHQVLRRHRQGHRRGRQRRDDGLACSQAARKRPGETEIYQGRQFKVYRGMGSLGAMAVRQQGPLLPAEQQEARSRRRRRPRALQGSRVATPYIQMMGGLRSGMGYCGCAQHRGAAHEQHSSSASPARVSRRATRTISTSPRKPQTTP